METIESIESGIIESMNWYQEVQIITIQYLLRSLDNYNRILNPDSSMHTRNISRILMKLPAIA